MPHNLRDLSRVQPGTDFLVTGGPLDTALGSSSRESIGIQRQDRGFRRAIPSRVIKPYSLRRVSAVTPPIRNLGERPTDKPSSVESTRTQRSASGETRTLLPRMLEMPLYESAHSLMYSRKCYPPPVVQRAALRPPGRQTVFRYDYEQRNNTFIVRVARTGRGTYFGLRRIRLDVGHVPTPLRMSLAQLEPADRGVPPYLISPPVEVLTSRMWPVDHIHPPWLLYEFTLGNFPLAGELERSGTTPEQVQDLSELSNAILSGVGQPG